MTRESPQEGASRPLILIVEDDKLMRIFYARLFKEAHDLAYHLEESAEGALDYLRENPVDAIVTDWDLPQMNGLVLVKAIRSHPNTKGLPIVVVSGRTGPGYMDIAVKAGASDYFSKPFEIMTFLDRLKTLLRAADGA